MKYWFVCILSVFIVFNTYVYTYVYAQEDDILLYPIEEDQEEQELSDNIIPELIPGPVLDPIEEITIVSYNKVYPDIYENTLSSNEILSELLKTNKEINENVKGIYKLVSNNRVSDSVLSDNSINNIVEKPLSEYDVKESLLLFILLIGISAGIVYIIHKTIFKWG